jgi:hypothetical protein
VLLQIFKPDPKLFEEEMEKIEEEILGKVSKKENTEESEDE